MCLSIMQPCAMPQPLSIIFFMSPLQPGFPQFGAACSGAITTMATKAARVSTLKIFLCVIG